MTMLPTESAHAQSDPSFRSDLRTGLMLPGVDAGSWSVSIVSAPDGQAAPWWEFKFEAGGFYTSNAGLAADDEQDSHYFTPSASASYNHPRLIGGWDFKATAKAIALYYGDGDSVFDGTEGSLDLQLARPFHGGLVSVFHRSTVFLDGDFDQQFGSTRDYGVGYQRALGERTLLQTLLFYQDANRDRDRVVARATMGHKFSGQALHATWSVGQRLQYSNYRDDARDDALLSLTTFGPTWSVAGGELSITARYAHNFSDGDDVDVFEIGPVFTIGF
jgi:hypothetical protein